MTEKLRATIRDFLAAATDFQTQIEGEIDDTEDEELRDALSDLSDALGTAISHVEDLDAELEKYAALT